MSTPKDPMDNMNRQKIQCKICSLWYHRVDIHIVKAHGMKPNEYAGVYPGAPLVSSVVEKATNKELHQTPLCSQVGQKSKETTFDEYFFGKIKLNKRNGIDQHDKPYIPKYDPDFICGKSEKKRWELIAHSVKERENVLITGPTGCGKSKSVLQMAAVLDQPVQRINLHGDVRVSDFIGDKTVEVCPKTNQAIVVWKDGVLPLAMRNGHWLLVDELDAAPSHILFVLQAVLEKDMKLNLAANNGEVIEAHADFRIIATANTLGRGDDTGLYNGTHILNESFLDRFGIVIVADYPSFSTEVKILMDCVGIEKLNAERMVSVARDVRESIKMDNVYCTFSTRRLISWAKAIVSLGDPVVSFDVSVGNRLNESDRLFVKGLVQRHCDL